MTNRFTINSSHQSFTNKQKDLFDLLENVEKSARNSLQSNKLETMDIDTPKEGDPKPGITKTRDRRECGERNKSSIRNPHMRQYKARESIFKRPEAPLARCLPHGRVPGFHKNPNQWTKYTLEDVKDEDMSDRSNTQAAFAFLKSIEKNKETEDEKVSTLPEKIIFKKSTMVKKQQASKDDPKEAQTTSFKSSKLVMPEYVVGQAVKRVKKKKTSSITSKSGEASKPQLRLNHLDDIDDECDD